LPSRLDEIVGSGVLGASTDMSLRRAPRGFLEKTFDIISRPSYAISEAVGAGRAGEDVLEGLWRGLRGKRQYPTLGYQAFPEAEKPGFQPEDIGAFAVDVLTDPLTWIGPGAIKAGAKPLAKLALRGAARLTPEASKILSVFPEAEKGLDALQKYKLLRSDMKNLRLGPQAMMKRMEINSPTDQIKNLFSVARKGKYVSKKGEVVRGTKETAFKRMLLTNDWLIDEMRSQARLFDANTQMTVRGSLGSLAQDLGSRFMPILNSARRFGGPAGQKFADKWEKAMLGWRFETEKYWDPLQSAFKNIKKADEAIESTVLRESGLALPGVGKASDAAAKWGSVLDEVRDELRVFRDPLGNELRVWNPKAGFRGRWEPFSKHIQPNYYPRKYPKEAYKEGGELYLKLVNSGMSHRDAMEQLNRLAHRPSRVGHIEMARLGDEVGYEMDPRKVLPKYISDVMYRKNMANEFGVNNEILDVMLNDMARAGMSKKWIAQVRDAVTGRNVYDRFWEKMAGGLTGFHALSKLGFATSVANFGQGPMNQSVRSGFWNTAKSIVKQAKGERGGLGAVAFSRATREDVMRGMMGGSSRFMDRYMRMIGFNWTERVGRHMGAIGGELEVKSMARSWLDNVGQAALGNKKAAREVSRLESELMRKYRIPISLIDEAGNLPQQAIEEAGIRAADKTMHAFFPGEMAPGWRSPFWRTVLQFKSFIYKQSDFLMNEVAGPGLQWLATDGAKGDIMPLLRAMIAMPVGAEMVAHFRDIAKAGPEHILSLIKEGKFADRDLKEFFWEADNPTARVLSDLSYVGTVGLLGDAIDAASAGRLWKYVAGPTISDIVELAEAPFRGGLGKVVTRAAPGALGIPYGTDLFESIQRSLRRRKLQ